MKRTAPILLALGVLVLLVSCAGVSFEYNNLEYLRRQLPGISNELLGAEIELDEKGTELFENSPGMTVEQFIVYMMMSRTIDPEAYLTMKVVEGATNKVIVNQHKRGAVTFVITMELVYNENRTQAIIQRVVLEDRILKEERELVTLEEKAGFALLILGFLAAQ